MILNQAMKFIRPKYALSSHSFTPQYEDNPKREYEVGILYRERNLLVDKVSTLLWKKINKNKTIDNFLTIFFIIIDFY
jgi:predicted N-formylglutamate amidohydrolase